MKKIIRILFLLIVSMFMLTACGNKENVIKIGHKNFTEQRILGQMFSLLIENKTDLKTEVTELGGTSVCYTALQNNEIDLYPEYTGTAYTVVLKEGELKDPQEVYDYVKKRYEEDYNMHWLHPLGFNNTYTLTVRKNTAEELGLKTISDLVPHVDELILGAEMEFLERQNDGLPGLKKAYDMGDFKEEKGMDHGLIYAALDNEDVDVNDAYSTDGRIAKFDLFVLEDDKQYFPPYFVSPLVTGDFYENYPEAVDALNTLENQLTEDEMQQINLRVDEGEDARDVAEEILKSKGLID